MRHALFGALVVSLIAFAIWRNQGLFARRERESDTARAILEAQLMEQLLTDLRSSHDVREDAQGLEIRRSIAAPGALGEDTVRWTFSGDRAVRQDRAGRAEWKFPPALRFRFSRVNGEIVPAWVAKP